MDELAASQEIGSVMDIQLNNAAQALPARCWTVRVELGFREPAQLRLPLATAPDPLELKHAILEACLSHLGPEITPVAWLNGRFDLMAVQYISTLVRSLWPNTCCSCSVPPRLHTCFRIL